MTTMLELVVGRWSVTIFLAVACSSFFLFSLPPEASAPAPGEGHANSVNRLSNNSERIFIVLATIICAHVLGMGTSLADRFLDHSPPFTVAGWLALATCTGFIVVFYRLYASAKPFLTNNYTFLATYPLFCLVAPLFFIYLSALLRNETFSLQLNYELSFFTNSCIYAGPWFAFLLWRRIRGKTEETSDFPEAPLSPEGKRSRWRNNARYIFWALIVALTITLSIANKDFAREYLASPQIGDIYVVKVGKIQGTGYDDISVVGLMKIVAIDEEKLSFIVSTKAYGRRRWLKTATMYFAPEETMVARNKLPSLYNRNIIESIERRVP